MHPDTFETTRRAFVCGDCVTGADLIVTALADRRRAVDAISGYLESLPKKQAPALTGLRARRSRKSAST